AADRGSVEFDEAAELDRHGRGAPIEPRDGARVEADAARRVVIGHQPLADRTDTDGVSAVWRERQREGGSALDRPCELLVDQHLETVAVAGTVDARDDQAFGRGLAGYLERACTRREGSLETERVLGNVVTRAPAVHQVAGEGAVLVAVLGRGDEIVLARLVIEAGTERQLATREAA